MQRKFREAITVWNRWPVEVDSDTAAEARYLLGRQRDRSGAV